MGQVPPPCPCLWAPMTIDDGTVIIEANKDPMMLDLSWEESKQIADKHRLSDNAFCKSFVFVNMCQ